MKAKFFFLGLCALALAACSLDEVSQMNDTNAIQFKATTATRAAAVTTNNLTEFSVWAWNGENEFMDDVIAKKGSNGTFTTSPLYFWPTGTVDFYALVPSTTVTAWESVNGVMTEYAYLGGELDPDHELTEDGTDWVYTGNVAKAQINNGKIVIDTYVPSLADEQIDLCYAVAKDQSSGSVPMNFRHALSQVAFKVTNSNPEFVVDIDEISLCSVYKSGTLTITDTTTTNLPTSDLGIDEGLAQGVWVVNKEDDYKEQLKGRFVPGITPTVLTGTDDGTVDITTDPLMLIPQEVVGWDVYTDQYDKQLGSYIRISCHVTEDGSQLWPNANEADETTSEIPYYAEIAVPIKDAVWKQGYRYTYTLIFGEGIGYYPPDDPNTELEGTPILVPITFTVTVDEFQDADNSKGDYDVTTDTDVIVYSYEDLAAAIARGLSPIEVAGDIEVTAALEVYQDCVLNLAEGVTISYNDDYVDHTNGSSIIMVYGGTLTINAGEGAGLATTGTTDAGDCSCIWLNGGNVIINGGTYKGASWDDGGTYKYASATIYVQKGFAYIYGGEFYGGYADLWGEDSLINILDSARKSDPKTGWAYVYGGTYYSFDPANNGAEGTGTNFCADGYSTVSSTDSDGNTLYEVVYTKVTSLTDLKSLISEGASEITIDEAIELDQGDVLYFTNDCHLTLNADLTYAPVSEYTGGNDGTTSLSIIVVGNGATLTIDAADGVNIACDGNNGTNGDDWVSCISVGTYFKSTSDYDAGHLIINGGNYKGGVWQDTDNNYTSVPTIYIFCGDVEINGGNFVGGWSKWSGSGYTYKDTGWAANTLNCLDAPRKANTDTETYAWFFVKGGSFREFNPANNASEGNNTNYVVDGYTSTSSTGTDGFTWWTVTKD